MNPLPALRRHGVLLPILALVVMIGGALAPLAQAVAADRGLVLEICTGDGVLLIPVEGDEQPPEAERDCPWCAQAGAGLAILPTAPGLALKNRDAAAPVESAAARLATPIRAGPLGARAPPFLI